MAFLPVSELNEAYIGLWGYNTVLTMNAISCVFFPFSPRSVMLAVAATASTSVAQFSLRENMVLQVREREVTSPRREGDL